MIQVTNLVKDYTLASQVYRVLNGITFTIPEGMLSAIIGPSGSGKTTLLNILGGLDSPTGGQYLLDGRDVSHFGQDEWAHERNHTIGFVFQSFQLIPSLSARDNVALPLVYRGVAQRVRRLRAEEELEKVGLGHRVHHRPQQLSGGQQQRVAIARALVADPPLLLADEPTGNLDHTTGLEILEILRELSKQGKTVVIVTHSAEVAQVCPQVIEIQDGHIVTNTVEMEHMR